MASYQDIDIRLKVVEGKVDFIMQVMRMKAVIGSGIVGPDGKPTAKVFEGSLLDLYRLSQSHPTSLQSQEPDHPLSEVKE